MIQVLEKESTVMQFEVRCGNMDQIGNIAQKVEKILRERKLCESNIAKIRTIVYEGEKNIALYASEGRIQVEILENKVKIKFLDKGPGISNIGLAFEDGYSTASEEAKRYGYGLGNGFSNIQKYSDKMDIASEIGIGTAITVEVNL